MSCSSVVSERKRIFGRNVQTAESFLSAWIRSPTGSSEDGETEIHTNNAVIVVGSFRSRRVACIWSADVAPISVTVAVRETARVIPSLVARDILFGNAFMRSAPLPGESSGICRVWHIFRRCRGVSLQMTSSTSRD